MSIQNILDASEAYDDVIRRVAERTGSMVIETADAVPAPVFHALLTRVGWTASTFPSRPLGWRQDVSGFVHLQGQVGWSSGSDMVFDPGA